MSLTIFLYRIEIPSYSNVYFNIWNVNATLILPNFPIYLIFDCIETTILGDSSKKM